MSEDEAKFKASMAVANVKTSKVIKDCFPNIQPGELFVSNPMVSDTIPRRFYIMFDNNVRSFKGKKECSLQGKAILMYLGDVNGHTGVFLYKNQSIIPFHRVIKNLKKL